MWEMRLQIQVVLHRAKAETDTFMARPERELLLPVRSESDVYYVDLALLFSGACPAHYVFYHINPLKMENGCGCYGRMKTMSGSRQLKWPWLLPGSVWKSEMVAEPGEPWSRVQVNKQHSTAGRIMISEHWGVCLDGGQWRCNRLFFFPFFCFRGTFSGTRRDVSHGPQASVGQGEKDQQASEGNLE